MAQGPEQSSEGPRLDAPAVSVVAATARALLGEARAAMARLDDPGDAEALHDLRVALRRLRSVLRAWRPVLPRAAAGRVRRALGELATATGEARDLEVQLEWLTAHRATLDAPPPVTGSEQAVARADLDRLVARLSRRQRGASRRARREVVEQLPRLAARIERRLEKDVAAAAAQLLEAPVVDESGGRYAPAAAARIVDAARDLQKRSRQVSDPLDEAAAHLTRIAAKRLRYLVEPLRETGQAQVDEAAESLVERLRAVQDALGDLHDAHVMAHVLEAARHKGLRVPMAALERRRDEAFARFDEDRRRHLFALLVSDARLLGDGLRAG